ncbi:transposase [Corallococcus sp. CA053C]|uniref:transposase n=1 Tax=Corallococcus sp. CA053C TaxID=2316732 RepID=UPI0034CEFE2F
MGQVGAVSFIQFFGSALQVTPHFHSLVPDGASCRGSVACASRRCRRPRKVRWSDCCEWCVTGCCAFWTKEGPSPHKGPRTRCRHAKRTRYSSG